MEVKKEFPYTEDQLQKAGLLGNGAARAAMALRIMRRRPDLLKLSLFTLQCLADMPRRREQSHSSPDAPDPVRSAAEVESEAMYVPDSHERRSFYNGINGPSGGHPDLLYRSSFSTSSFPKPSTSRWSWGHIPVKSPRGVYDTPLNAPGVWSSVLLQIGSLIQARGIHCTSIDPVRFYTHGEEYGDPGCLGPPVIWIGVWPGSTDVEKAHEVSQAILLILCASGVHVDEHEVVVEWREAVPQRLAGSPLLHQANDCVPGIRSARRFLTPLLGVPLATLPEEGDATPVEATLTLWFHEGKDMDGNPSDRVFGVTSGHVLRRGKETIVEYQHRDGAKKQEVHVCGAHRFQRGIDEIRSAIAKHAFGAALDAEDIADAEEEPQGENEGESEKDIRASKARVKLEGEMRDINALEALHDEFQRNWSEMKTQRNIGYFEYASRIGADNERDATPYTSDWCAFVADREKVQAEFEGNVVDLEGNNYTLHELISLHHCIHGGSSIFEYPLWGKLRIEGCSTKEDLANSLDSDNEGQRCLVVGKDGNATDLTFGLYAGLESLVFDEGGNASIELAIYNAPEDRKRECVPFSAKGDSGALVWCMRGDKAWIVGQLHSGQSKGSSTSNHISYCTPGWFLLDEIRKKFPYADFYRETW